MKIKFYTPNKNNEPINCGEIDLPANHLTLQEFENIYNSEYLYYEEPFCNLILDTKYYMIIDDNIIFGVFSMGKGYTFIDCAEHDERVMIKRMFPYLKCNIINEKNS